MKVYTDSQIDRILGELNFLTKELSKEQFNNIGGESLSVATDRILDLILQGDKIEVEVKKKGEQPK